MTETCDIGILKMPDSQSGMTFFSGIFFSFYLNFVYGLYAEENTHTFPKYCLIKRVYSQFWIETLHERHNRIQRLVVCLSEIEKK